VDEAKLDLAIRASEARQESRTKASDSLRQKLTRRLAEIRDSQDSLARKNGTPEDVYARNMASLRNEQVDLETQLANLDEHSEEKKITFEQLKNLLLQRKYEARVFKKAEPVAQREYASVVLSNVGVRDQKPQHPRFKPAYQILADLPKDASIDEVCAYVKDIRTLCDEDSAECQEMIAAIREIMCDPSGENPSGAS